MWKNGLSWFLDTSKFLEFHCLYCLLGTPCIPNFKNMNTHELNDFIRRARDCEEKCRRTHSTFAPFYCYRCRQTDHTIAGKCSNLKSHVRSDFKNNPGSDFRCAGCFLTSIGGHSVHFKISAGPKCLLRHAASFCFAAYAIPHIRSTLLDPASPYGQSVAKRHLVEVPDGPRRFFSWLTDDRRPGDPAGLLLCLQYLFQHCDLEKLKPLARII